MGDYKPVIALLGLQFMNAGIAIFIRAALVNGLSPLLFVFYRHAISTFILSPLYYFSKRNNYYSSSFKLSSLAWIFFASLGLTANQGLYFEGLSLASSTVGSATNNLIPAITFVMAVIFRMEKVKLGSLRSLAKIIGTLFCVCGAISMALFKGSTLLKTGSTPLKSIFGLEGDNVWLLGCLLLFASSWFYSLWMILQVPISASCPDHLHTSVWMSLLVTTESAAIMLFAAEDFTAWKLKSYLEVGSCLYAGIVQALAFIIQAWCISERGPLFTAMFNPLATVIVTIVVALFLHEETYAGSLVGAFVVVIGLYIVLWGKAKDLEEIKTEISMELPSDDSSIVQLIVHESTDKRNRTSDLEVPFISHDSVNADENG